MGKMNTGGTISVPSSRKISLDKFDSLPIDLKKAIWYCPLKLTFKDSVIDELLHLKDREKIIKEQLDEIVRKSCLETYGPDHPQSH